MKPPRVCRVERACVCPHGRGFSRIGSSMSAKPGWGRRGLYVGAVIWVPLACNTLPQGQVGGNGGNVQPFTFSLRVARQVDQPLSASFVDATLAEASTILQVVDSVCPDVATPVTFARNGDIDTFDVAPAVVTTEAQLDDIFRYPADLKVVTMMVGVCGTFRPGNLAVVLGCGVAGDSAVLTRDAPTDVWAHEWGHVQGLPHRDDCRSNLMHTFELETNAVNATERNAFLTPTPGGGLLRVQPVVESGAGWLAGRAADEPVAAWLEELVSRRYLAGIPEETLALESDPAVATTLLAMLAEKPTGHRRLNVLRALGLAGDPAACPALMAFVDSLGPVVQVDELAAAAEALLALGRLAAADESGAAVAYLVNGTDAATWRTRGFTFAGGAGEDLAEVFARFCIMSLGVCEHPAALERLLALQDGIRSGRLVDPWLSDQVDEAVARFNGDTSILRARARDGRMP